MIYTKEAFEAEELALELYQLCENSYAHGSPWTAQQFLQSIEENSLYLILKKQQQLLGFVAYQMVLDEVEIIQIAIAQDYKGKGYGQQLLEQFILEMSKQQVAKIFLEVRASNQEARHFYQKNAFQTIFIRKDYYQQPREDGIMMCWEAGKE